MKNKIKTIALVIGIILLCIIGFSGISNNGISAPVSATFKPEASANTDHDPINDPQMILPMSPLATAAPGSVADVKDDETSQPPFPSATFQPGDLAAEDYDYEAAQRIYDHYFNMSPDELLLEMDNLYKSTGADADALLFPANAFFEKSVELTESELLSIIQNDQLSDAVKVIAIQSSAQINHGAGIHKTDAFWDIAADPDTTSEVKQCLINNIPVGDENDLSTLDDLIYNENGDIAWRAINTMQFVDFNRALDISNRVLADYSSYNIELVRGAAYVKAQYYREAAPQTKAVDDAEKQQFINVCLQIFDDHYDASNYPNPVTDSMVIALKNMQDFDAMKAVMTHEGIDDDFKSYSVYENFPAIEKAVQNGLSSEDRDILIDAMEILPVVEICELLDAEPLTKEQEVRLDSVMERMDTEGLSLREHNLLDGTE